MRTRAEQTGFAETSRYADVMAFLEVLRESGAPYAFGTMATSTEGRAIPYVIASRPRVVTPDDARRSGRLVVYVNANIHAGEVEGKEAVLALLRDLAIDTHPNVLDSLVLVVVPIYNADGNERFGPQAVNRPEQNGPESIGVRPNGKELDLNRDYVKLDAVETRGALALMKAWNPDIYVDLHTTDGSYHGYGLTYAPSLAPGAPLGDYSRELLATLRDRLRDSARARREGRALLETFDYGNFDAIGGDRDITDSVKSGWYSYDPRPRYGTNYFGLRGRIAVLSEAFSHDPFERRVASTALFLRELFSLVAERTGEIQQRIAASDRARSGRIPLDASITANPNRSAVLVERLKRTGDSVVTEPGVPRGVRRTGKIAAQVMPVYDRFDGRDWIPRPVGYLVPASDSATLTRLALHGIATSPIPSGRVFSNAQTFRVDSVRHSTRVYQGHREARVIGTWSAANALTVSTPMVFVSTDQPLGTLAVYLLEPTSADGFATWNAFDAALDERKYPIVRIR